MLARFEVLTITRSGLCLLFLVFVCQSFSNSLIKTQKVFFTNLSPKYKQKNHINQIKIAVILSHPVSSLVSAASKESNKFFKITTPSILAFFSFQTLVTNGWASFTYLSHIPSHPMIINSSLGFLSNSVISGLALISCSSHLRLAFCLQLKSPRLRERFNPPLTRPLMISPPAFWMRLSS